MTNQPEPLFRFSYTSVASAELSEAELGEIARASWRNNHRRGLTGCLEYRSGAFRQVIEGRAEDVTYLLAAILADSRHHAIRVVEYYAATGRQYEGFDIRGFPSAVSPFVPPGAANAPGPRLVASNGLPAAPPVSLAGGGSGI